MGFNSGFKGLIWMLANPDQQV